MRRLALATVCCYLVAAGAAAAADAPDVQERIVPGQAIGRVRVGMTLAQVKKVLGQPEAVIKRERRSLTRQWVEYSWSFTSWRVAFQIYRGTAQVVAIRSSIRGEKTKEGVGYGTLATTVQKVYETQCKPAWTKVHGGRYPDLNAAFLGYGCIPASPKGVFFLVNEVCGNVPSAGSCAQEDRRWIVLEYGVIGPGEKVPFEFVPFDEGFPPLP